MTQSRLFLPVELKFVVVMTPCDHTVPTWFIYIGCSSVCCCLLQYSVMYLQLSSLWPLPLSKGTVGGPAVSMTTTPPVASQVLHILVNLSLLPCTAHKMLRKVLCNAYTSRCNFLEVVCPCLYMIMKSWERYCLELYL